MSDRRAELIAGAVRGDLSDTEAEELRQLTVADPTVGPELDDLRTTAEQVAALQNWQHLEPSAALRARVLSTTDDETVPASSRSRRWLAAGAAACVTIGVVGAVAVSTIRAQPPSGPPGTLGAVEHVEFTGEPEGVTVFGDLVAHTWGTETVLEIDGLPAGERFAVVLVARDGGVYESGTFLGSEVTIDCRMNAALLRPDVADVEIRDDEGVVVGVAHAPAVS